MAATSASMEFSHGEVTAQEPNLFGCNLSLRIANSFHKLSGAVPVKPGAAIATKLIPRGVTVTQRPLEALFMVRIHAG